MLTVTRFAPSPTGYLHLGHAFAALTAWRRARQDGGRFLLRLEDIDPGRCRPDYAMAIQEDLSWLGLDWDGPVRRQSEHLPAYQRVLDSLSQRGLTYPCFCTRADIAASAAAAHGPDDAPVYPGTCRRLSADQRAARIAARERFALRLDMAVAAPSGLWYSEHGQRVDCRPERFGDIVLARKDAPASYHLCATHDDAVQQVTVVTRAEDLKDATDVQRVIQALAGWPVPHYEHHRLLRDAAGRRLAKRDHALALRTLRAEGVTAKDVLARLDQPA
jgi:glutamyl-Q tRNA(Asp) synthetase